MCRTPIIGQWCLVLFDSKSVGGALIVRFGVQYF